MNSLYSTGEVTTPATTAIPDGKPVNMERGEIPEIAEARLNGRHPRRAESVQRSAAQVVFTSFPGNFQEFESSVFFVLSPRAQLSDFSKRLCVYVTHPRSPLCGLAPLSLRADNIESRAYSA
ncbi:unnamed protein product [Parajaminaea phylloscopi]